MLDNIKRYIAIGGAIYIGVALLVFGTAAFLTYKLIMTKQLGTALMLGKG